MVTVGLHVIRGLNTHIPSDYTNTCYFSSLYPSPNKQKKHFSTPLPSQATSLSLSCVHWKYHHLQFIPFHCISVTVQLDFLPATSPKLLLWRSSKLLNPKVNSQCSSHWPHSQHWHSWAQAPSWNLFLPWHYSSPGFVPIDWPLLLSLRVASTPMHCSHLAFAFMLTPLEVLSSDQISNIYTQMTPNVHFQA